MGGEHPFFFNHSKTASGSSPRGRGTFQPLNLFCICRRFIPAWAGNIWPRGRASSSGPVHPRVGGEHLPSGVRLVDLIGSSPRGRGTSVLTVRVAEHRRFIPAWAGNIPLYTAPTVRPPVHPRVGGEHFSPRFAVTPCTGSSPRGRGTCAHPRRPCESVRFIPAWAGNIRGLARPGPRITVHPRVGGEHGGKSGSRHMGIGSSPRGRGTLNQCFCLAICHRFIPAWAGEHFEPDGQRLVFDGSSPRGRGTYDLGNRAHVLGRFIPAWAGNIRRDSGGETPRTVHPRVGGEH